MPRAALLSALAIGLLLAGCMPAPQSQTLTAAPTATPTTVAGPTAKLPPSSGQATAANGSPAAKPIVSKPTAAPSPTASAAAKPVAKPSPAPNGAAGASASSPAVVATSVAGLPNVAASPASKPAAGDALGVAASANAAAAATAPDEAAAALCGPGAILSTRARQAAGRSATIAITKVDGSYQPNVRGQPTFLNDAPFPNHTFTVVIWGSDRRQFNPPPEGAWQGKALCVSGPVELFQQKPQIVVSSPSQLRAAR